MSHAVSYIEFLKQANRFFAGRTFDLSAPSGGSVDGRVSLHWEHEQEAVFGEQREIVSITIMPGPELYPIDPRGNWIGNAALVVENVATGDVWSQQFSGRFNCAVSQRKVQSGQRYRLSVKPPVQLEY